jgi:putative hemolysin
LDNLEYIIKLASLFGLAILAALFSAVEELLNRLTRNDILKITEAGGTQQELLTSLLRRPQRYSATIVAAKSALVVAIVVLFLSLFNFDSLASRILSASLATLLIVVVTEFIPKNYVQGSSENSTIFALRFLQIAYWMLYVIIAPLTFLSNLGVRVLGGRTHAPESGPFSPEVLETLVNVGDSQEILEEDERQMISRILDLPDKVAREIMIARTDMTCIDVSTPQEEVLRIAIDSRHSRIPVYEEQIDHIIGVLHVKDMLDYWAEGKLMDLRALIADRTPFFIPETKKISELFRELRANKQHMAIVVDEYGGTAGLVTLEDIIEEIVGEIQDEYDFDDLAEWIETSKSVYSVDARMALIDFNERLDVEIESESVDTIGGFIVDHLGKVPTQGTQFSFQA